MTLRLAGAIFCTMSKEPLDTRETILTATWQLLESKPGQEVSMSAIAKASGISRQAVYLHFPSRTELMIATSNYVDELKGLPERLAKLETVDSGEALLDTCVEVWCSYIPEIYGIAKAFDLARASDEAMAAAWDNNMACLLDVCKSTVKVLHKEGKLSAKLNQKQAAQLLYSLISFNQWEQLTQECGWSTKQFVQTIQEVCRRSLLS